MAVDLLPILLEFFAEYGLYAMFILLVLDGAMLMPVLPGEAVMIMAVSQYGHSMADLVLLIGIATAAAIVGSLLLYGISRVGGRPLIERHPRLFMMDKRRRESLEETFQKPLGQTLVLFLRIIPLTRIIVNIPAGLAKMGVVRFTILSSIGMLAFHSGFMWLAYQGQQSGSVVSQQIDSFQEAYAVPAWQYLQANEVVAVLGALALGAWISFRSSRRMLKYPDGAILSILGWLSVRLLVLGSLAIAGLLWYDPTLLYELALAGGTNIPQVAGQFGLDPIRMLAYFATLAWSVGVILWALEAAAKRKRDRVEAKRRWEESQPDKGDQGTDDEPATVDDMMDFEETSG